MSTIVDRHDSARLRGSVLGQMNQQIDICKSRDAACVGGG